jgi:hypothetical protein
MSPRSSALLAIAPPLLIPLLLAGCGGGDAEAEGGGEPPVVDTTPPFTQANPGGGLYPAAQQVTLTSNEPAAIYYTLDGSTPSPGGVTTFSGVSPVVVNVDHALSLKYFAVDLDGNAESLRTEAYSFDLNAPIVLLGGGLPTSLGLIEQGLVTFSVDEQEASLVSWNVEVGGGSTPGTGVSIAGGTTPPSTLTQFSVPGWRLPLGASTSVHIFCTDQAGGVGYQVFQVAGLSDDVAAFAGESGALGLTSDSAYLYVARPLENRVVKLGALPGSGDYLQELASLNVGPSPTALVVSPDDAFVYVTCGTSVYQLDVASDAVVQAATPPSGVSTSGCALAPDGLKLYLVCDDGLVRWLNTDPTSGAAYLSSYNSLIPSEPQLETGELVLSADGTRAILSWRGGGLHGTYYLDTSPSAPDYLAYLVAITNESPNQAALAIAQDGSRAWLGDGLGRLARATLSGGASAIQTFNQSFSADGITPAPDESVLILSGGGVAGLRFADAETLQLVGSLPSGATGFGGTSRDLAVSADGKRAYLVRNQGDASAELQVLQLLP